jgi:tetratricopeptide (TPR) repeat protein
LEPEFFAARSILGLVYYHQSRVDDSLRELESAVGSSGRHPWALWMLGTVCGAVGDRRRAEAVRRELESRAQHEYIAATHIASIHAVLGEVDEAFVWLEKAYEERAPLLSGLVHVFVGWPFEELRADPRYADLMRRAGINEVE